MFTLTLFCCLRRLSQPLSHSYTSEFTYYKCFLCILCRPFRACHKIRPMISSFFFSVSLKVDLPFKDPFKRVKTFYPLLFIHTMNLSDTQDLKCTWPSNVLQHPTTDQVLISSFKFLPPCSPSPFIKWFSVLPLFDLEIRTDRNWFASPSLLFSRTFNRVSVFLLPSFFSNFTKTVLFPSFVLKRPPPFLFRWSWSTFLFTPFDHLETQLP